MSVRDEFRDHLAVRLLRREAVADEEQAKAVAEAVTSMCYPPPRRDYMEVEVTTLGDAEERWKWSMVLTGTLMLAVEDGEYRRPHRNAWVALP